MFFWFPIRIFYFRSRSGNDQRLNRTVKYDYQDYPDRIYLSDGMVLYDSVRMNLWGFSNSDDFSHEFIDQNLVQYSYQGLILDLVLK